MIASMKDERKRDGDCFKVAADLVVDHSFPSKYKGAVLVHGMASGRGEISGVRFGHAWVEIGDEVIDYSNGLNARLPKELYYAIGNIKTTLRYSRKETMMNLMEHKHYGPWEKEIMADYQVYNDASDRNDPRNAPDCPEDSGFENEMCQGCSGFQGCATDWPHPSDCKCLACEDERELEVADHAYRAKIEDNTEPEDE